MSAVKDLQPAQMEKKGKAAKSRLKCRHREADKGRQKEEEGKLDELRGAPS